MLNLPGEAVPQGFRILARRYVTSEANQATTLERELEPWTFNQQ